MWIGNSLLGIKYCNTFGVRFYFIFCNLPSKLGYSIFILGFHIAYVFDVNVKGYYQWEETQGIVRTREQQIMTPFPSPLSLGFYMASESWIDVRSLWLKINHPNRAKHEEMKRSKQIKCMEDGQLHELFMGYKYY